MGRGFNIGIPITLGDMERVVEEINEDVLEKLETNEEVVEEREDDTITSMDDYDSDVNEYMESQANTEEEEDIEEYEEDIFGDDEEEEIDFEETEIARPVETSTIETDTVEEIEYTVEEEEEYIEESVEIERQEIEEPEKVSRDIDDIIKASTKVKEKPVSIEKVAKEIKEEAANTVNYNKMTEQELYILVRKVMVELGVVKKPVPKRSLVDIFGRENIARLHRKGYLIFLGDKVTMGLK